MCSFITQHNTTVVASFEGACNWHVDCRNVHQSFPHLKSVEMFLSEINIRTAPKQENSDKLFSNVFRNSEADPHFPIASEPHQLGV